jgi:hypothetical protein
MAKTVGTGDLIEVWGSDRVAQGAPALVAPNQTTIEKGFVDGIASANDFTWVPNVLGAKVNHVLQNGVPQWVSTTAYVAGNVVGRSNNIWLCLIGNTNSAPTDTNTNWVRVATRAGGAYALPTNYSDIRVNYTDANTITLLAGSRVRSSDDTTDIIFSSDRTCVLNASGSNGLDTGTEASNTWYHLYAIYNPTTLTSALLFSTVNEAVSGSITLPSGFTKKRQLKFSVRNDGSSNIVPFTYINNGKILIDDPINILASGGNTVFIAISATTAIPPTSRIGLITGASQVLVGGGAYIMRVRKTGSGVTNGTLVYSQGSNAGNERGSGHVEVALNSSQQLDYLVAGIAGNIDVNGYIVTEVL